MRNIQRMIDFIGIGDFAVLNIQADGVDMYSAAIIVDHDELVFDVRNDSESPYVATGATMQGAVDELEKLIITLDAENGGEITDIEEYRIGDAKPVFFYY